MRRLRRETILAVAASALVHVGVAAALLTGVDDLEAAGEPVVAVSTEPTGGPVPTTRVRLITEGARGSASVSPSQNADPEALVGRELKTSRSSADAAPSSALAEATARPAPAPVALPSDSSAVMSDGTVAPNEEPTREIAPAGKAMPDAPPAPLTEVTPEAEPAALARGEGSGAPTQAVPGATSTGRTAAPAGQAQPANPGGPAEVTGSQRPSSGDAPPTAGEGAVSRAGEGFNGVPSAQSAGSSLGGTGAVPSTGGPDYTRLSERLAEAARGCYPAQARRLRLRGQVVVEFSVTPAGSASGVEVVTGSGSALLDRAATECVVPRAFPVPGIRGAFRMRIDFGEN